ncbi:DUF4238 domain-containing protein [Vibrio renipiscarius]|uniref:DUF4238 domain-containing protein n=1 Tax=Vibrio renipiscarius TaxID=1461322 RepID=A0A0C2K146_9VIBR|nr:DUF4238 domain-containing protein [Vibrio renipiscarius]KII75618.1 hypothetical protein PL18_18030 [Vibrio renipiscarius]KII81932.1 hypothetical protein OJ16_01705 [Vibrio renipiscarius]
MQISLPKHLQIKKEHHYVWAHYLRNWSNTKKVWFVTAKGKVIYESTKLVAKEKFFYKVQYLNNAHIACIKALAALSPSEIEREHQQLLEELLILQHLEELAEINGTASIEIKQEIKAAKENWLENKYTEHEEKARFVISKLAKGRLSVLNNEANFIHFCHFIGHQFARTKSFKSTANVMTNRMPEKLENQQYLAKISMECRWFSNYLIGENFGASLYQTNHFDNYCMLINHTEEPFITSDQPVVNVHESITDEIKQISVNECDLYYPLSPKYALIISSSNNYPKGVLKANLSMVQKLNTKLAEKAHMHIFGSQESVVKKYTKLVGYRDKQLKTQELPVFLSE